MLRIILIVLAFAAPLAAAAPATATVTGSLASPQPVGTAVGWTATYSGDQSAGVTFRWSVAVQGGAPRIVRDYSPASAFTYMPLNDGPYVVTADVRDASGNPIATGSAAYTAASLLGTGGAPAATATANPLVAIYSTSCKAGKVRVHFALATQALSSGMTTPYYECQGARATNIIVAGMKPISTYTLQEETASGLSHQPGSSFTFQTGPLPASLKMAPLWELQGTPASPEQVLLISMTDAFTPEVQLPAAYDLSANPIWYYNDPDTGFFNFFRAFPGGTFSGTYDNDSANLREVDLLGNLIHETNAARVSEQLQALGYPPILNFSHDAYRLPSGYTAVLAQCLGTADQGSGPQPILGDEIVVLDNNWQVAWVWNSFEKLDATRAAILGEVCVNGAGGCPVLSGSVPDWTHANALTYTAGDGNLLISLRSQDWVLKIDYRDGRGSGDVIWHLGPNGDFASVSSDPYPWFTHQHDAALRSDGTFTVYDNGNTRVKAQGGGNSRGQVWKIDEVNMTATLVVNDDLGKYSLALGSTRYLSNGDLHFDSGFLADAAEDETLEMDAAGNVVFRMGFYNAAYRSFRLFDLYSAN